MNYRKITNELLFYIIAISLLSICNTTGADITSTDLKIPSEEPGVSPVTTEDATPNLDHMLNAVKNLDESDEKITNLTENDLSDSFNTLFKPFLPIPLLSFFNFQKMKRDSLSPNASERTIPIESEIKPSDDRAARKPFFFIDFELNIQKIPLKNQSNEQLSSDGLNVGKRNPSKKIYEKFEISSKDNKETPFDLIDGDWPLIDDDLPLIPSDMEEFLPKSDFLFFDFPFHRRQNKKLVRNKRNNQNSPAGNDFDLIVDIFDGAVKKEIERSDSLWDIINRVRNGIPSDRQRITDVRKPNANEMGRFIAHNKRKPHEFARHKNPVMLSKIVKLDEFHFGDDHVKGKKKRMNSFIGQKGVHEKSEQMNEPIASHAGTKDVLRKTRQHDVGTLLSRMENSKMTEEKNVRNRQTFTPRIGFSVENSKTFDNSGPPGLGNPKEEMFTYVEQTPKQRDQKNDDVGFEILKPQSTFSRMKRQKSGQVNVIAAKDEVKKNITQVLGQFFAMVKKLGDSKDFYAGKQSSDGDNKMFMEMSESHFAKNAGKVQRRPRESDDDSNHPVADLTFLFFTVTLPTMIAFSILLIVCYLNLRLKGWLCSRILRPRNVYVVEKDVEKTDAKKPRDTTEIVSPQKAEDKPSPRKETRGTITEPVSPNVNADKNKAKIDGKPKQGRQANSSGRLSTEMTKRTSNTPEPLAVKKRLND